MITCQHDSTYWYWGTMGRFCSHPDCRNATVRKPPHDPEDAVDLWREHQSALRDREYFDLHYGR